MVVPHLAAAQACSLAGIVYDAETRLPLAAAAVQIHGAAKAVYADAEGHFFIPNMGCADSVQVHLALVGYQKTVLWIPKHRFGKVVAYMTPAATEQKEVEIVGHGSASAQFTGQRVAALDGRALLALQGIALADQLATLAGVNSLKTGPTVSKPVIHGLYGNRVLIMQNGVRQEGQAWGADHSPELDPFGSSQLQVISGASALRYGTEAVAGVILAIPAPLPTQKALGGHLQFAGFSNGRAGAANLTLEGGAGGKWAGLGWRVQGSGRRGGMAHTPTYYLANTGFAENSYSAALGYTRPRYSIHAFVSAFANRLSLFSGASVGSVDDLNAAIARAEPLHKPSFSYKLQRPYQWAAHQLAKVQAHYHFTDLSSLEVVYAFQQNKRAEYDRVPLYARQTPELDLTLSTHTLTAELHHHLHPGTVGVVGLHGLAQTNTWVGQFFIPNYNAQSAGAFVTERLLRHSYTLEAGARVDSKWLQAYFRQDGTGALYGQNRLFWRPTVSMGAEYTGLPVVLGATIATAWRAPSANELYSKGVHQGAASYEQGNAAMHSEVSYTATATATYTRPRFSLEAAAYANRMQGFIYLKPDLVPIITIRGAFPAFTYTQTQALLLGADVRARWQWAPRWVFTHKSSWLRGQDLQANAPLINMPANRLEHSLRYLFGGKWRAYTPYIQASAATVFRQTRVPPNSDYAPPPPAYTLAGLELGATLPVHAGKEFTAIAGCTNLLNTVYRDYLNRFRYFAPEMGRNIALRLALSF